MESGVYPVHKSPGETLQQMRLCRRGYKKMRLLLGETSGRNLQEKSVYPGKR
jgi:hypothetical protein